MAKQRKAIKCPNCASVNKTKLDNAQYHCENCNTNYLLDNLNTSNNNRQEKSPLDALNISKNKTSVIIISCIIGLLFLVMTINTLIGKADSQKDGAYSDASISTPTLAKPTDD